MLRNVWSTREQIHSLLNYSKMLRNMWCIRGHTHSLLNYSKMLRNEWDLILQILKHRKLENKNHHFWHNGKQNHNFILDALPNIVKREPTKFAANTPFLSHAHFITIWWKTLQGAQKGGLSPKEVQCAKNSIINYIKNLIWTLSIFKT